MDFLEQLKATPDEAFLHATPEEASDVQWTLVGRLALDAENLLKRLADGIAPNDPAAFVAARHAADRVRELLTQLERVGWPVDPRKPGHSMFADGEEGTT